MRADKVSAGVASGAISSRLMGQSATSLAIRRPIATLCLTAGEARLRKAAGGQRRHHRFQENRPE